jgi:hypothetical protein
LSTNLGRQILENFLENSRSSIQAVVGELHKFDADKRREVHLLEVKKNQVKETVLDRNHFFLRTSVEYSNPQLTLEELQGIIVARLIEVCGDYFCLHGLREVSKDDVAELCNLLGEPPVGRIVPFLLNTDDVEPDRYSVNPLRESIVESGQSAFPSASVKTNGLMIDEKFVRKYEGSLISRSDVELIEYYLANCGDSYVNMVDAVKQEQLKMLSEPFGINLCLPVMRMPLKILEKENADGLLHHVISETHKDYESIERVYSCMGRSMKNRTTLLTVPHSKKGFGSKRAARGKIYFEGTKLKSIQVTYKTTSLYPNDIDPKDVSIVKADDQFTINGDKFVNYDFRETPSSPQFILYSLGSPEDSAIWHGIGESGAAQLVKSFTSVRLACTKDKMIRDLEKYGIEPRIPLQFNLAPENMWIHPTYGTIDTSIGSVGNLEDLARMGMRVECLSTSDYARQM